MTTEERIHNFQQAALEATMAVVTEHAPDLPVHVLATHMRQIGGDLFIVSVNLAQPKDYQPFRLRVTVYNKTEVIDGIAVTLPFIERIVGWR